MISARVAIVIPCWNAGEWIEEAVASALAQTGVAVEVIVADDGSTDPATQAALDRVARRGVRVLGLPHQGVSAARNAATAATSASYILPLDADDRLGHDYARRAAAVLDADDSVGIVTCRGGLFGVQSGNFRDAPFDVGRFLSHESVLLVSSVFRRGDWQRIGGFREGLDDGEDLDFWFRLLALGGSVVELPEVLMWYRQHAGQATRARPEPDSVRLARIASLMAELPHLYVAHAASFWAHRTQLDRTLAYYDRPFGLLDRLAGRRRDKAVRP